MKKTTLMIVIICAYLGMGAEGCDATPPDVLGTWHVNCEFTNPVGTAEYYWEFLGGDELTAYKSWETLSDGSVKKLESFYVYQQTVLSMKNPEAENADKLYYVSATDADHLDFKGGEYSCKLERATNPHN